MAKTPNTTAASAASAASDFQFDMNLPVPSAGRPAAREQSDLVRKLMAMPLGASFLEPVVVPENVDEAERGNVWKEKARAMSNRLSGAVRRLVKTPAASNRAFVLRTVNDDTMGHGVRVWRVTPKAETEVSAPTPNAAE